MPRNVAVTGACPDMVDNGIFLAMNDPWVILGQPESGGILVVCDHASNHVPEDIDLGIDPEPAVAAHCL